MKQVIIMDENGKVIDTLSGDLVIAAVGNQKENNIECDSNIIGEYIGLTRMFTQIGAVINKSYVEQLEKRGKGE